LNHTEFQSEQLKALPDKLYGFFVSDRQFQMIGFFRIADRTGSDKHSSKESAAAAKMLAVKDQSFHMIMGEIRRFLRDDGIIRVSRSMKEAYSKIRAAREILLKQNGEEPTIAEIASFTGLSDEEIVTAMEANASPESLYADNNEQDKSDGRQLIDKLGKDEPEEEKLLNNIVLREVLKTLNKRDKKIIDLRYFEHKTQVETAQILGISQVQISRLEKRILSELKGRIG
jgi:RNA polymerase sporulation-specific sigma factor